MGIGVFQPLWRINFAKIGDTPPYRRGETPKKRENEEFLHGRPTKVCSLYWYNRMLACFQEKDTLKRDELVDRVWWEAADELTDAGAPLGPGALATYAIRLKIAIKRSKISKDAGMTAFDRLAEESETGSKTN